MTKHPRMIAAIAFVTLAAVALTGCLVDKKEPDPPYYRKSGDTLRIHEPGDYIYYTVEALLPGSSEFQYGTLKILWKGASDLPGPDGKNHPVIEKHYLLCMNEARCEPTETVFIQYVHQDPPGSSDAQGNDTSGTERFVAMDDDPQIPQYYWINTRGSSSQGGDGLPEPSLILKSPLQSETYGPSDYYLMDDCVNASPCISDLAHITSKFTVIDDNTEINTRVDRFANPFKIQYESSNNSVEPLNNSSLPTPVNLFSICSMDKSQYIRVDYSGKMYVVPEIGMIKMINFCQVAGDETAQYIFTIDSLSFGY